MHQAVPIVLAGVVGLGLGVAIFGSPIPQNDAPLPPLTLTQPPEPKSSPPKMPSMGSIPPDALPHIHDHAFPHGGSQGEPPEEGETIPHMHEGEEFPMPAGGMAFPQAFGVAWDNGGDIDFTEMDAPVAFSAAVDITGRPSQYAGRKIRLAGTYHEYEDEKYGDVHRSLMVKDAEGCCQHGIEFEPPAGTAFSEGDELVVSGVLDTYKVKGGEEILPDWVNKADKRYDGVLNATIIKSVVVEP